MLKVLADRNLYRLSEFLPNEVELITYDPNVETPKVEGFDALFIRSVTKINRKSFNSFPARLTFIGTGSSGNDHVDRDLLKECGIHFVDAKGSNANVVAEYVVTSLILLSEKEKSILNAKIGIVGVGAVGSRVYELLTKLGHKTVLYDPPREQRDPVFKSASLDEVLNCDVITLHTPLVKTGSFSTYHWLDSTKLLHRKYLAVINAARGGVLDECAVMNAKKEGSIKHLVIDVWEHEPNFDTNFVDHCDIATPHIAGSSIQSKMNASRMLAKQFCNYFGLEFPKRVHSKKEVRPELGTIKNAHEVIAEIHPILTYDSLLRDLSRKNDKMNQFAKLRTDFPFRNEYSEIRIPNLSLSEHPILMKLGITN